MILICKSVFGLTYFSSSKICEEGNFKMYWAICYMLPSSKPYIFYGCRASSYLRIRKSGCLVGRRINAAIVARWSTRKKGAIKICVSRVRRRKCFEYKRKHLKVEGQKVECFATEVEIRFHFSVGTLRLSSWKIFARKEREEEKMHTSNWNNREKRKKKSQDEGLNFLIAWVFPSTSTSVFVFPFFFFSHA